MRGARVVHASRALASRCACALHAFCTRYASALYTHSALATRSKRVVHSLSTCHFLRTLDKSWSHNNARRTHWSSCYAPACAGRASRMCDRALKTIFVSKGRLWLKGPFMAPKGPTRLLRALWGLQGPFLALKGQFLRTFLNFVGPSLVSRESS